MFLSRSKKNNVYPYKPQFYYIKMGFQGVKIILVCFHDGVTTEVKICYKRLHAAAQIKLI